MTSKLSFLFSFLVFLFLFAPSAFSRLHPNGLLDNTTNQSPFEFLRNMQGCRKGDKVKGIHDLKLYLSHFGYLNYQSNPDVTNPKEDNFDDELEEAIKSYQVFYHLNATGMLDVPTVSKMVKPRCGSPDMETHQHSDKTLHFVSRYQFFPYRQKWPKNKRHITFAFGSSFPTKFMPAVAVAVAFSKWAAVSQYFTFSRAITYQSADIKIKFARGDHGDGYPFDGRGGVLAHAFAPTSGRIHYDADEIWVIGAVPHTFDIETLALHEIGHVLALGHSKVESSIMWPTFETGVTKGLNFDDFNGIRALYGNYGN